MNPDLAETLLTMKLDHSFDEMEEAEELDVEPQKNVVETGTDGPAATAWAVVAIP